MDVVSLVDVVIVTRGCDQKMEKMSSNLQYLIPSVVTPGS